MGLVPQKQVERRCRTLIGEKPQIFISRGADSTVISHDKASEEPTGNSGAGITLQNRPELEEGGHILLHFLSNPWVRTGLEGEGCGPGLSSLPQQFQKESRADKSANSLPSSWQNGSFSDEGEFEQHKTTGMSV